LEPADDELAFLGHALEAAELPEPIRAPVESAARPLSGDVRIVDRGQLPTESVVRLEQSGILLPVFRAEGALLVVLPEIRVEESRSGAPRQNLANWLSANADRTTVFEGTAGRIEIRPLSGKGAEALALANSLAEEVGPELAQARFVRLVPRPGTKRRRSP
jgi:hypothetical protein